MQRFIQVIVSTVVIFSNVNTLKINKPHNPVHQLSDIISDANNKPLIVVVNTVKKQRNSDFEDLLISGDDGLIDDDGSDQKNDASDDAAYILYHLLRTTKQDDEPDPVLEDTKEALRHQIRIKCKKVEECVIECPSRKPSCPMNCQQVFDQLNLCPTQKPKRPKEHACGPKCGKTMPPKWFFF